jgi:hypothetical protein
MQSARRILALTLTAALLALPVSVRAQSAVGQAQGDSASRAGLVAERQRLRVELERANAEIDALKHTDRSLRDDYRLRARLADAEALARRLTALDARLGSGVGPRPDWSPAVAEPRVSPGDGPSELEAKADILSDQSRRLAARADALFGRARDLRARQNLRRRVGQMERDPFSPLEGSKRGATVSGPTGGAPVSLAPKPTGGSGNEKAPGSGTTVTTDVNQQPGPALGGAATPPPVSVTSPSVPSTQTASPGGIALTSPKSAPAPTSAAGAPDGVALSVQLRDLLDPTTLAELRRIEAAGGSVGGIEALERASAALRARAERLGREAEALRASQHPAPRTR